MSPVYPINTVPSSKEILRRKFAYFASPDPPVSIFQLAKMSLVTVTLVPVRIVLIFLLAIFVRVGIAILTLGYKPLTDDDGHLQPMGSRRRFCLSILLRPTARLALFIVGFHWIKVSGSDNLPRNAASQRGILVVANHVSMADSFYLGSWFVPSFVYRHDVASYPIIGTIALATQGLQADRANKTTGSVTAKLTHRLNKGYFPPTAIFPEGVTTNERYLLKFRTGAFVAGKPLYPVVFRYPFRYKSPYYGDGSIFHIVFRLLCQIHHNMEVTFLPQYVPNEAEKADPALFAENVRQIMRAHLSDPPVYCTDCTNQEYIDFSKEVRKRGCQPEDVLTDLDYKIYENKEPFLLFPTHIAREVAAKLDDPPHKLTPPPKGEVSTRDMKVDV